MAKEKLFSFFVSNKELCVLLPVLALLFCSWEVLYYTHGNNIVVTDSVVSSVFQSINSWMPLIAAESGADTKIPILSPKITMLLFGVIYSALGDLGVVLIGQVLLPLLCFLLLYLIFNQYVSKIWSLSIATLALLFFSALPFRSFLVALFSGSHLLESATYQPLEILHFPFPSFSTFVFLLLFYFSTLPQKFSLKNISIFTTLWSLSVYVHLVDGFFGLIFWFTYFSIRSARQNHLTLKHLLPIFSLQAVLSLLLIAPIIFSLVAADVGAVALSGSDVDISLYYYLVYFVMPLLALTCVYGLYRVDPYEILFKFWHVYSLLVIEFLILFVTDVFGLGVDIYSIQNRIAIFFLHFYYYIPVLFFLTKTGYSSHREQSLHSLRYRAKKIIEIIFIKYKYCYLVPIILLLILNASLASFKSYQHYLEHVFALNKNIQDELDFIKGNIEQGRVVVSFNPAVNLALPILGYQTLWKNRFNNNLSEDIIIEQLALYAKIAGWSQEQFVLFMSTGALQKSRDEIINLSEGKIFNSGVGYWLAFHNREVLTFEKKVILKYQDIDYNASLKKYNVQAIVVKGQGIKQYDLQYVSAN